MAAKPVPSEVVTRGFTFFAYVLYSVFFLFLLIVCVCLCVCVYVRARVCYTLLVWVCACVEVRSQHQVFPSVVLLYFSDSVSLCSLSWPETWYADQVDLRVREIYLLLPSSAVIKGVYHHSQLYLYFLRQSISLRKLLFLLVWWPVSSVGFACLHPSPLSTPPGQVFTGGHDPCDHWRPWGYLWAGLPPGTIVVSMAHGASEAMLVSVIYIATGEHAEVCSCDNTGDHVHVYGPCRCQKTCGSPWSVFPLTLKGEEIAFAVVLVSADS